MTSEDDFQRALDANPEDWQTRLVFADWLQERGDPRAEGYRALGMMRKRPVRGFPKTIDPDEENPATAWSWWGGSDVEPGNHWNLPADWRSLLPNNAETVYGGSWQETRREAEDAAALAFAKLPAERRRELLESSAPAVAATA